MNRTSCTNLRSDLKKKARDTIGLKWAPETGPHMCIAIKNIPSVARVLPSYETASSVESASPIIPEATIVQTIIQVPNNSAKTWRGISIYSMNS